MRITTTSDVEGVKAGTKINVPAGRGRWLVDNGYATANDSQQPAGVTYSPAEDPTLAVNREPAETPANELPGVGKADNAAEVNWEVAAFPADVDPEPKGDDRKIEAPEIAYQEAERRPALLTPAPTTDKPERSYEGIGWGEADDDQTGTPAGEPEPDITAPDPVEVFETGSAPAEPTDEPVNIAPPRAARYATLSHAEVGSFPVEEEDDEEAPETDGAA